MKKITVFTPTYNRAKHLVLAYESLLKQTSKDFEWLIVDDGSSDNTEDLVNSWKQNSPFEIKYIFQQNQGKHVAINTGVKNTSNDYFLTLDSDDILLSNCIEELIGLTKITDKNKEIASIVPFIQRDDNFVSNKEVVNPVICYEKEFYYETPYSRENVFCFKTEILKKFPFPQFPGEKFCPESLVFSRITRKYKLLFYPKALLFGKYLSDGLTSKYWKVLQENPNGYVLWLKEKIKAEENSHSKRLLIKKYWSFVLKTKKISFYDKFTSIGFFDNLDFFYHRIRGKK